MPVIGQGSFGCVHRPSLKCETTDLIDYTNKISKLLIKKEADKEIKQYEKMDKVDPDKKYSLDKPIKCKLKNSETNIKQVKLCDNPDKFLNNNDIRLLIMDYGGFNLSDLLKTELPKKSKEEKIIMCEKIIIYLYNVFEAIKLFNKKKVTHRDIKSENIVMNFEEKKISVIDFGIMDNYNNCKKQAKTNTYRYGMIWWSIPPYALFINNNSFDDVKTIKQRNNWFNEFIKLHGIESGQQMKTFYNRISRNNLLDISVVKNILINDLNQTMNTINNFSHDKYLNSVLPLLDIHNLGTTVLHVLTYAKLYIKNDYLIEQLKDLGLKMISFNVFNHIRINEASNSYKKILEKSGLLEKYNFIIKDDEIKQKQLTYTQIVNEPEKYSLDTMAPNINRNMPPISILTVYQNKNKSPKKKKQTKKVHFDLPSRSKNKNLSKSPIIITKKTRKNISPIDTTTPPGKIRNPRTGRFINMPSEKTQKATPPGKTRNPKTGRFINKPVEKTRKATPPGKTRNPKTGRFINKPDAKLTKREKDMIKEMITILSSKKTKKNTEKINLIKGTLKRTPPGKKLNPKTGRYVSVKPPKTVKKTPPGKIRNPKTGRFVTIKPTKQTRKKTPPGKMRNPKTGRFITIPTPKTKKPCPPGKIINEKTGRCVEEFKTKRFYFF